MIIDCNHYILSKQDVKNLMSDKTHEERLEHIGMTAVATSVPIIVVCCFVGQMWGFTDDLKRQIARLVSFYTVKEVKNSGDINVI